MKRLWIVLVTLFILTACGGAASQEPSLSTGAPAPSDTAEFGNESRSDAEGGAAPAEEAAAATPGSGGVTGALPAQAQTDRKIIYTAFMRLRVDEPLASARALQGLALRFNGFVSSTDVYESGNDIYQGTVQLRVDADQFNDAMAAIRELGTEVLTEQLDTADVTDQFVDLEARIRNLEAAEEELRVLLTEVRENNGRTEDILAVYSELTAIRGEIEVYQGQLNSLGDSVDLATITIELIPPEAQVEILDEGWSPARTFRESLRTLAEIGQGLADLSIRLIIVVLPFLLVLGLILFALLQFARWVARRGGSRSTTPTTPPTPSGD